MLNKTISPKAAKEENRGANIYPERRKERLTDAQRTTHSELQVRLGFSTIQSIVTAYIISGMRAQLSFAISPESSQVILPEAILQSSDPPVSRPSFASSRIILWQMRS